MMNMNFILFYYEAMYGVITDPNTDFPIFKWVKLNNHIPVQKLEV